MKRGCSYVVPDALEVVGIDPLRVPEPQKVIDSGDGPARADIGPAVDLAHLPLDHAGRPLGRPLGRKHVRCDVAQHRPRVAVRLQLGAERAEPPRPKRGASPKGARDAASQLNGELVSSASNVSSNMIRFTA